MSSNLDPQREYESPVAAPPPRGNANEIEVIAAGSALRLWAMRTRWPLDAVLSPGFFEKLTDVRLRKDDRIELIADCYAPLPTHATIVVDSSDKHGRVTVSLLHKYERQ